MNLPEYVRYVGRMKHPLQKMDAYNPSMFALADSEKYEMCLIILTPGVFCHAYDFIKKSEARTVRIFFPSLRPEFVSDIMNLYMALKNIMPVKWVFPETYNHYSFSMGHEKCGVYYHTFDPTISIEYKKNEKVNRLYDLIVRCEEGTHYFSLHMTDSMCTELFYCRDYTFMHVSKSAPVYGGMCYDSLLEMNRKFRKKLVPFDFTSIEEYLLFKEGKIKPVVKPTPPPKPPIHEEEDNENDKYYPGHPPIHLDGTPPGRPVDPDDSADVNYPSKPDDTTTPEEDEKKDEEVKDPTDDTDTEVTPGTDTETEGGTGTDNTTDPNEDVESGSDNTETNTEKDPEEEKDPENNTENEEIPDVENTPEIPEENVEEETTEGGEESDVKDDSVQESE